ncbi:solute carrier family 35 member F5 isoform X2 [Pelobates cultripes]|uniref:Solute carrier family 35 member F5 n=1 Tax=Pelobates cultripes TaxID=61616 RepID=A0AAD1WGB7_PELCU|nr:solute carrier family 35 member F5 isoform X2 [Pelobates cultripes]
METAVYQAHAQEARTVYSKKTRVRFSNLMEVRQLPSSQAVEAKLSRMSHITVRDGESVLRSIGKLSVCQVAKISFFFCFVWFLANYSYQEALSETQVAIVNVISSTSGLFTLILASVFPSNSGDRFTLSKLLAVVLSIGGVVLVTLSGSEKSLDKDTIGSLWSLAGAMLYAVYIVMIKRKVDREDKLDIPMFFGFVGLFNLLLLWPGFFLLHYTGFEAFEFPSKLVWAYLVVNGLIGTVLSEFLWLWGCFLTSSLIGTLALSLTIPLSIIADICMQKVRFSWVFFSWWEYGGFLALFAESIALHGSRRTLSRTRALFPFTASLRRMEKAPSVCTCTMCAYIFRILPCKVTICFQTFNPRFEVLTPHAAYLLRSHYIVHTCLNEPKDWTPLYSPQFILLALGQWI